MDSSPRQLDLATRLDGGMVWPQAPAHRRKCTERARSILEDHDAGWRSGEKPCGRCGEPAWDAST